METQLKCWNELGVVDTIYEEEEEEDEENCKSTTTTTTTSLSSSLSLPPTPLHSRVQAWCVAMGCETDVLVHVRGSSFNLHKDPLTASSNYLKRHLNDSTEITISPPLNISSETFTLVAEFCYGSQIPITPFNVAALRVASELLEMTHSYHDSLREKTEDYFCRALSLNQEYVQIIFRSCLSLLPEAETVAAMASRCVEALILVEDDDDVMDRMEGVKSVTASEFEVVAESMHCRLTGSHDLIYRIVDLYLKEQGDKLTEEQKTRICNSIDCTMLSPQILMHAVQNPRFPLRFIVQAMFIEQLNTRRSIISAATRRHTHEPAPVTLGAILHRDAALRQSAHLKASMNATASRIQTLEKELHEMRSLLQDSSDRSGELEAGRSASCRFSSERKIERGGAGSVSSASFRNCRGREKDGSEKSLSWKLLSRLKSAFRGSSSSPSKKNSGNNHKVEADHGFEYGFHESS